MIKRKSILMILIFILLFGCKSENEIDELNKFYSKFIINGENIVNIDFTKKDSVLIQNIENKLDIDLCDENFLTAKTSINNLDIYYPVIIDKNCTASYGYSNLITISVNLKNEILINSEFDDINLDLSNRIIKITNEMMMKDGRNSLLYNFSWIDDSQSDNLKFILFQVLKDIKTYADSISVSNYEKPVIELNDSQTEKFKNDFYPGIIFFDYQKPPPPPPNEKN